MADLTATVNSPWRNTLLRWNMFALQCFNIGGQLSEFGIVSGGLSAMEYRKPPPQHVWNALTFSKLTTNWIKTSLNEWPTKIFWIWPGLAHLAFAMWGGGGCRQAYNLRRSIRSLRFNLVALISSSSYQLSSRLYLLWKMAKPRSIPGSPKRKTLSLKDRQEVLKLSEEKVWQLKSKFNFFDSHSVLNFIFIHSFCGKLVNLLY